MRISRLPVYEEHEREIPLTMDVDTLIYIIQGLQDLNARITLDPKFDEYELQSVVDENRHIIAQLQQATEI
jgi:hypothetical protein